MNRPIGRHGWLQRCARTGLVASLASASLTSVQSSAAAQEPAPAPERTRGSAAQPPRAAHAPDQVDGLRQELRSMRADYEARIRVLERKLEAASPSSVPAPATAAAPAAATDTAATPGAAQPSAPPLAPSTVRGMAPPAVSATASGAAARFNPAMWLVLSGRFAATQRNPDTWAIAGPGIAGHLHGGPGTRGLSLQESELGMAANIDPWWRGEAYLALHSDGEMALEQAFVQTTALGHGFTVKAGRFFSSIGYLNAQHAHQWDFVDNPLAYQAFLGTQYGDDGVQLRWVAPLATLLDIGLEVGRGRAFPAGRSSHDDAGVGASPGMYALTAHSGGDIGDSASWRGGLSMLHARARGTGLRGHDAAGTAVEADFSGRTRLWIADAVWTWAPDGNPTRRNLKVQAEYFRSSRNGRTFAPGVAPDDSSADPAMAAGLAHRALQSGWYLQSVYQFMPRWRVGARVDMLDAGRLAGDEAAPFAVSGHRPSRWSLLLEHRYSEFSRLRMQVALDRARPGVRDAQFFLQYQMSLGAHAAHSY